MVIVNRANAHKIFYGHYDKSLLLPSIISPRTSGIGKPETEGSLAQRVSVEKNTNYTLKAKASQPQGQTNYFNLVVWNSEMNPIAKNKDASQRTNRKAVNRFDRSLIPKLI